MPIADPLHLNAKPAEGDSKEGEQDKERPEREPEPAARLHGVSLRLSHTPCLSAPTSGCCEVGIGASRLLPVDRQHLLKYSERLGRLFFVAQLLGFLPQSVARV